MKKLPIDDVRHERPVASPLVEAVLALLREKARARYAESGQDWTRFAMRGNDALLTGADMAAIEQTILASGHRFDWSAAISQQERPDIYKPREGDEAGADFMFVHPDAPSGEADANGRALRGVGDNVVRHAKNTTGTARYIRSSERVMRYIAEGVPPGTIAIIDDSGGTLTAPIVDQFAGVICAGGTVRSHLGILTREYNIPCLMNAKITGLREGDLVTLETTADPRTAEDYQAKVERHARVWLETADAGEGA